jgi:RNA recognition motif-containing protein
MLPNGRSKGQGTVLLETKEEATKAIELFDGTEFQGRKLAVHEDRFVS